MSWKTKKVKKLEKNKVALEQKLEKVLNELEAIKVHLKKFDKVKYKLKVPKK